MYNNNAKKLYVPPSLVNAVAILGVSMIFGAAKVCMHVVPVVTMAIYRVYMVLAAAFCCMLVDCSLIRESANIW